MRLSEGTWGQPPKESALLSLMLRRFSRQKMQLLKNKNKNLIPAGGRHLLLEGNQHSLFLVGLENLRWKFFGDQSLSVGLYSTGTSPRAQLPLRQPIMPNHQAPPSSSPSVAPLTQATLGDPSSGLSSSPGPHLALPTAQCPQSPARLPVWSSACRFCPRAGSQTHRRKLRPNS